METRYIRFGQLPTSGKSFNSLDQREEAGVSCYKQVLVNGQWRIDGAWGSYRQGFTSGRQMFEIAGIELSETGADGETLLSDAKVVRKLRKPASPCADCWTVAYEESATRKIYSHLISGAFWNAGVFGVEFRETSLANLLSTLSLYGPVEKISAALELAR